MKSQKPDLFNYTPQDSCSSPFKIKKEPCICECHAYNCQCDPICTCCCHQLHMHSMNKGNFNQSTEKSQIQVEINEKKVKDTLSYQIDSNRTKKKQLSNSFLEDKNLPLQDPSFNSNQSNLNVFQEGKRQRIKYELDNVGSDIDFLKQRVDNNREYIPQKFIPYAQDNNSNPNILPIETKSKNKGIISNSPNIQTPTRDINLQRTNVVRNKDYYAKYYDSQYTSYSQRYPLENKNVINQNSSLPVKQINIRHFTFMRRQNFSFELIPERNNRNYSKDIIIEELNRKIRELNKQINYFQKEIYEQNQIINQLKDSRNNEDTLNTILQKQNLEIEKIQNELVTTKEMNIKLKNKISYLQMENENQKHALKGRNDLYQNPQSERILKNKNNSMSNSINSVNKIPKQFDNNLIESLGPKLFYIGNPRKTNKKILSLTSNETKSKIYSISNEYEKSRLLAKFNLNNDLSKIETKYKTEEYNLSDELLYKISDDKKNIICFDFATKQFHLLNYADYGNYDTKSSKDPSGDIFITFNNIFYIVTGANSDLLYSYQFSKNAMNKLCPLNNNHHKGALISFQNNLLCLSGSHNKKAEIYSIVSNKWGEMPEMNRERAEFSATVIREKYIFALFGYNVPKNEYLNSIEFFDLEKEISQWTYLNYKNDDLVSVYIKGSTCVNYQDEKIIIVGGFNGEIDQPVENFIQLILGMNFLNEARIEMVERKLKDTFKNKGYMFSSGFSTFNDEQERMFEVAFDNDYHIHVFQVDNMAHDVFYLN